MPDVRAIDYTGSERLTMNMGPQHPSAHGVFRAILTLEGETVVAVDAVIGYLHRCHEKLGEMLTYVQYPSIASKTDYVAAMTAELAYVSAVEKGAQFEVPKLAQEVRLSGPPAPCSGLGFDVRRAAPYSSDQDFDFKVPVETAGDCYARYRVRMVEFRESIKIVRQVLDGLPEGPISSRPGVKSVGQVRIAKGEGYGRVEGARGEVGCYLVADGGPKPYRLKWRGASFSNLAILP